MIKINPKIRETLQANGISIEPAVIWLLSVYHGINLPPNLLSPEFIVKINFTKIVERDYTDQKEDNPRLIWNIPLYEDEPAVDENWAWVDEWRKLFGALRPDAIGSKKDCYSKMKKFFATNPHIRKEDIFSATKMYINTFRGKDVTYLQKADYFISKIVKAEAGTQYGSRLEMYLEILKNSSVEAAPQASRQLSQVL